MTRRLNLWLAALLLAIGIPFYWYLLDTGTAGARPHAVTVAQLRHLSGEEKGRAPSAVHVETIGHIDLQANRLAAGTGMRSTRFMIRAFKLAIPGQQPIVIDAGVSPDEVADENLQGYDERAQKRVDKAITDGAMLVQLSDRLVHSGKPLPQGSVPSYQTEKGIRAIAPGVVAIPATGLPGSSQMLYVRLRNGSEYLFAGDAALTNRSWREVRPPARLETQMEGRGARRDIASWLMTINALHREAPDMVIVAGHDAYLPGTFVKGFATHRQVQLRKRGEPAGHERDDNVLARPIG